MKEYCMSDEMHNAFFDFLIKKFNSNGLDFKQLIDAYKNIQDEEYDSCLYKLLENTELIQDNRLNTDDLKYLLNKIDNNLELYYLCHNTSLLKHILNEFVLDKEVVDKFNVIIEKSIRYNLHTIFELIEYCNKDNEEILKLIELNRKIYTFDLNENQKLELIELIQNNEIAKNRLNQIIDNHLETAYDFESLMKCLKKQEKKNTLNI